jgi:hypothetical protein
VYRYGDDKSELYVEEGTERVPDDGQFYILHEGRVLEYHSTLKKALARHNQLKTFGVPDPDANPARRALHAEIADQFMRQSRNEKRAKATRKGGKGGSGGVGG